MNFESKNVPEIRIAPENKAINPDKIPKRPEEKQPEMFEMNIDQLLAFMSSHLEMKVNMQQYNDPYDFRQTKTKIQKIDMTALRILERAFLMHLVQDHGYGDILLKSGD
jgi:hypothetical protein